MVCPSEVWQSCSRRSAAPSSESSRRSKSSHGRTTFNANTDIGQTAIVARFLVPMRGGGPWMLRCGRTGQAYSRRCSVSGGFTAAGSFFRHPEVCQDVECVVRLVREHKHQCREIGRAGEIQAGVTGLAFEVLRHGCTGMTGRGARVLGRATIPAALRETRPFLPRELRHRAPAPRWTGPSLDGPTGCGGDVIPRFAAGHRAVASAGCRRPGSG